MHVDEFIDSPRTDKQASWFLMLQRMPATLKCKFDSYLKKYSLRCKYDGDKWHIIGASRLGDVWLSKNGDFPYEKRVDIADCTDFLLWEER